MCTKVLFTFMYWNDQLQIVDKYRYLGILFTKFLSYNDMAKSVTQSTTRALGLLIDKCNAHGGLPFNVLKLLFNKLQKSLNYYCD